MADDATTHFEPAPTQRKPSFPISPDLRGYLRRYRRERDLPVSADGIVTARVEASGPLLIDVEKTLVIAAQSQMFDEQARHVTKNDLHTSPEEN